MADAASTARTASLLDSLTSQGDVRSSLASKGWWFSLSQVDLPSKQLASGDWRLDAEFFTADSVAANDLLSSKQLRPQPLSSIADLYVLGRFKRIYTPDSDRGSPYLSASEAFLFRPGSSRFLARQHLPQDAARHFAQAGSLLLSTSGSVGRPLYVTKRLERFFLTHDLARIVVRPESGYLAGYVYAVLASSFGVILRQSKYGAAVRHIEPSHLKTFAIPRLPLREQRIIHDQVVGAYGLRDQANALLDRALDKLYAETGVNPIDQGDLKLLSPPAPHRIGGYDYPTPRAFEVKSSQLRSGLAASGHDPTLSAVRHSLGKGRFPVVSLSAGVSECRLPNRFKRTYVDSEYGVPFLQGSDLPLVRPFLLKYISRKDRAMVEACEVRESWVLVTRSGTIGEVALVPRAYDHWTVSEHVIRIVPRKGATAFHPGYIAAYLMTPLGRAQLTPYGAVVMEITPETVSSVLVPSAPASIQSAIGSLVMRATELRADATRTEDEAVSTAEQAVRNLAAKGIQR